MFDLKTNQWEQLNLKGCPSARSGHRMVIINLFVIFLLFLEFHVTGDAHAVPVPVPQILYKHKLIVFGGFYDTLREVR